MWDETHLKALLRLPRFPARLIQQDPWRTWIRENGGLSAIHAYLRACDLSPEQHQLLDVILAQPYTSTRVYARQLNVSATTYFKYLRELLPDLLDALNALGRKQPPPPSPLLNRPCLTNLPALLSSLIGVEEALPAIHALLTRPEVRLLTLTGPGGIGKTRLAVEAATRLLETGQFPDGVFFVALAPLGDPAWVAERTAQALGLAKTGQQPIADTLKHYLRERRLLLVLDNFEHLLAAAALITDWLTAAPMLKVLVTSRTTLNVYGEHIFTVPPLDLPSLQRLPPLAQVAACPAVQLFVERAQAVKTDFALTAENAPAIAEICARLDGLPLAIELAAACVKILSPQEMLPYLNRRLTFLKNKAAYLHERSLRETIDWSYELLTAAEQTLFRRLAVFANGWTATACQAINGAEADSLATLESLLNKSLVRRQARAGVETRFEMLETIREYALERLRDSSDADIQRRHAVYYLTLVEAAEPELSKPEQKQWLERLEVEHDNLRAALEWLLAQRQREAALALRLTGALWKFWHIRGYNTEGRRWIERTLAQSGQLRTAARVKTLYGGGWLYLEELARSGELFAESLMLARELGDSRLIALTLQGRGESRQRYGAWAEAQTLFEESLARLRELGDDEETAWVLDHLGRLVWEQEDYSRASELFQESLLLFRKVGHLWGIAHSFERLGAVNLATGNYERATTFFHESLLRFRELGDKWQIELVLEHAGLAAFKQGDFARASVLLIDSLRLNVDTNHLHGIARSLILLAKLADAQGNGVRAARLGGAVEALRYQHRTEPMRLDEESLAAIRSRLDGAALAVAWAEGQAMTLADALAYAAQ